MNWPWQWRWTLGKRRVDPPPDPVSAALYRAVFISPSFDHLTTVMSGWLRALAERHPQTIVLIGIDASASMLRKVLEEISSSRTLLVFFGHGWSDSLLTAPDLGFNSEAFEGKHSRLCIANDLELITDLSVVAFCCRSAKEFGRRLAKRSSPARFLGFRDDLPFIVGTPAREDAFSRPIQSLVRRAMKDGAFTAEDALHVGELYEEEERRWAEGDMRDDPRSFLVAMFLDDHRTLMETFV